MNAFKTGMLMAVMTALFMLAGAAMGGRGGMMIALGFAVVTNFFSYWFSDKIVLAMYRAKEASRAEAPRLYASLERLTSRAELPMPKVYLLPDSSPNAFATGRNPANAAVAATSGLVDLLNDEELEGVLAHELAHVQHRDILIGTIVGTMASAISILATMAQWTAIFGGRDDEDNPFGFVGLLVSIIVLPFAAMLIQMGISRNREYSADRRAGELTGRPAALASALRKITIGIERRPMNAGQSTAHLFIANPISGRTLAGLFSTHPDPEERIALLLKQQQELGTYI